MRVLATNHIRLNHLYTFNPLKLISGLIVLTHMGIKLKCRHSLSKVKYLLLGDIIDMTFQYSRKTVQLQKRKIIFHLEVSRIITPSIHYNMSCEINLMGT